MDDVSERLEEIQLRNDEETWKVSIQKELNTLKERSICTLIELLEGKKVTDNKWVFKFKRIKMATKIQRKRSNEMLSRSGF